MSLVYVVNYDQTKFKTREEQHERAMQSAAFIGQNVYLFCASEVLATCYLMKVNHEEIAKKLTLSKTMEVIDGQCIEKPGPKRNPAMGGRGGHGPDFRRHRH